MRRRSMRPGLIAIANMVNAILWLGLFILFHEDIEHNEWEDDDSNVNHDKNWVDPLKLVFCKK